MSQNFPHSPKTFGVVNLKAIVSILGLVILFGLSYHFLAHSYIYDVQLNTSTKDDFESIRVIDLQPSVIFEKLDTNGDGQLSLFEFLSYEKYYKISLINSFDKEATIDYVEQGFPELSLRPEDGTVTVECFFKPLLLSSLTKDVKHIPRDHRGSLEGLLQWTQPFKKQHVFSTKIFSLFLPPKYENVVPGKTWWIVKSMMEDNMSQMSSSRHFPPHVEQRLRPLFALLTMFHPRPFLHTRFAPQGTIAVLRAIGEDFLDIVFRVHAEFQLNEPPAFPFWFTPAQFHGRLIINQNGTVVQHFHLEVPNQRKLNVDMEWLNGPTEDSMEVDIGYIPEMVLSSKFQSLTQNGNSNCLLHKLSPINNAFDCSWTNEITMQEAMDQLNQAFYPFQQVKYRNMTEAFQLARSESKLVHGIILWGNLDDQSC